MQTFRVTTRASRDERRDEIAALLLEAVERLLTEGYAYSELSVDRLVTEAGISRSRFYRYFADKGELLQSLARDVDAERRDKGLAIWQLLGTASRHTFGEAVQEFVEAGWEHRVLMSAVSAAAGYDPAFREEHEASVSAAIDLIAGHISTGQAGGWVRRGLESRTVAAWLVHMADRGLSSVIAPADRSDLPDVAAALSELLWLTLYEGHRDSDGSR